MDHQVEIIKPQQIGPMTRNEAVEWENKVGSAASQLRVVLAEGYEREAWKVLGHSSWSKHLRALADRFGFSQDYAWKQFAASQNEKPLLDHGLVDNLGTIPERRLRPLTQLDTPDQKREVWTLAVESAPGGKVTGAHVQSVVESYTHANEEKPADYNYLRDNRRMVASDIYTPQRMDACQTPGYALDPLLPYLPKDWVVWEPAAGEGNIVEALFDGGFKSVVSTDLIRQENFFEFEPDTWDCIVTNPPFSIHFEWLERCYKLGQPFALLLKVDILGTRTAQELFDQHGIEVIFVSPRINFKMPNKGWDSSAQFATAWFTYGLNIGRQMTFARINTNGN